MLMVSVSDAYRTCDEIVNWFDMSDDERKSVMIQLDSRAESSFD